MNPLCKGCGEPIPPSRGGRPRVWCSERCRKAQYAGKCAECGAPTNGHAGPDHAPQRCAPCNGLHTVGLLVEYQRERWEPRRQQIVAMWAQGKTMQQIADTLGTTRDSISNVVARLRQQGYDLPYRRCETDRARRANREAAAA